MKKIFVLFFVLVFSICLFVGVSADSGDVSMTLVEWVQLIFDTMVDTFIYFTDFGPDGFVADIWESFKIGFNNVVNKLDGVGSILTSKFNELKEWLSALNETTANFLRRILNWFTDLNDTIASKFRDVIDWMKSLNSTIASKFTALGTNIIDLGPKINTKIQNLIDKIQSLFASDKNINSSIVDDAVQKEDALNDSISSDLQHSQVFYNYAYSILISLGSALSAVTLIFNKFVNIPFFGSLLYVSISVGIVSAILGLAGLVGKSKE